MSESLCANEGDDTDITLHISSDIPAWAIILAPGVSPKTNVYEDMQEPTSGCSKSTVLSDRYKGKIRTGQVTVSCIRHGFLRNGLRIGD